MKDLPLISIALCTYNGEKYLCEQLDSICAQSYQNIEIIIQDDCSTDDTEALLKSYAATDNRIDLSLNQENLGYNRNFEKALQRCRGEFIAISDQDDIWDQDKLMLQFLAMEDHMLIYHDSEFIDSSGNALDYRISDKFHFYKGSNPNVFLFLNCVSGHSILMRRSVLYAAVPFPAGFHYDQWLAYVATSMGSIHFLDQCLVKYRQHDQNSTDMLAVKKQEKTSVERLRELQNETDWLCVCSRLYLRKHQDLVTKLHALSLERNDSFMSLRYGLLIWKNNSILLFLLKKNKISKLFYTLRKIWGVSAKKLS
jgi:glycosyltransferase involved in cell wall biosynthesis